MKKNLCILLSLCALLTFCACGSSEGGVSNAGASNASTVTAVMEQQMNEATATAAPETAAPVETEAPAPTPKVEKESVDVDFTEMSTTVAYSQLNDMVSNPENYMGKKVRIWGNFDAFYYEDTDTTYYNCLISDATACCQNGLEFKLAGASSRDDYPEQGALITVVGTFSTYQEYEYTYAELLDAHLE